MLLHSLQRSPAALSSSVSWNKYLRLLIVIVSTENRIKLIRTQKEKQSVTARCVSDWYAILWACQNWIFLWVNWESWKRAESLSVAAWDWTLVPWEHPWMNSFVLLALFALFDISRNCSSENTGSLSWLISCKGNVLRVSTVCLQYFHMFI